MSEGAEKSALFIFKKFIAVIKINNKYIFAYMLWKHEICDIIVNINFKRLGGRA